MRPGELRPHRLHSHDGHQNHHDHRSHHGHHRHQDQQHHRQKGAALAYVLSLLVVVGVLVGLSWRIIRSNNAIAAIDRGDAQARLLAFAGVEYALAKIGPPGPKQDLGYSAENLTYRLPGFNVKVQHLDGKLPKELVCAHEKRVSAFGSRGT